MHPIHDVDALLLLATALSSKRRPADLVEIVAALDLLQGDVPREWKLADSFARLSKHGLIIELEGRYTLPPVAQKMMAGQPAKAETPERLFAVKQELAAYESKGDSPAIALSEEQFSAAILAHRTAVKEVKTTALMPKPKPAAEAPRPGQRKRKPLPAGLRRRK
jgi:hypothetical protein